MTRSHPAKVKLLVEDPTANIDSYEFGVYDGYTDTLLGSFSNYFKDIDNPTSSTSYKNYSGFVTVEVEFALTNLQLEYRYRITGLYYGTSN